MTKSPKALWILTIASIAGLVLSFVLFNESIQLKISGHSSGSCHLGEGISCDPALKSNFANFPPGDGGFPLPVIAGAFYFMSLAISLALWKKKIVEAQPALRFLTIANIGSGFATLILGYVAFFELSAPCPFCFGLYIANALSLGACFALKPNLKGMKEGLAKQLKDPLLLGALVLFVLTVAIGNWSYNDSIESRSTEALNAAIEQGKADAAEINTLSGPFTPALDLSGLPVLGDPNAPIKIVEFSDFECPFCSRFRDEIEQLHKHYPAKDLAIYFVNYPLDHNCNPKIKRPLHNQACHASKIALCAQEQSKFWPMHDKVFDHFKQARSSNLRGPITDEHIAKMAKGAGVNLPKLRECLKSTRPDEAIKRHLALAERIKITGTPTWFINGHKPEKASGNAAYIQILIDRLLKISKEN